MSEQTTEGWIDPEKWPEEVVEMTSPFDQFDTTTEFHYELSNLNQLFSPNARCFWCNAPPAAGETWRIEDVGGAIRIGHSSCFASLRK